MGSKTYHSIPKNYRPLKGRLNVILTRSPNFLEENNLIGKALTFDSFDKAIDSLNTQHFKEIDNIYIIGGGSVYNQV